METNNYVIFIFLTTFVLTRAGDYFLSKEKSGPLDTKIFISVFVWWVLTILYPPEMVFSKQEVSRGRTLISEWWEEEFLPLKPYAPYKFPELFY